VAREIHRCRGLILNGTEPTSRYYDSEIETAIWENRYGRRRRRRRRLPEVSTLDRAVRTFSAAYECCAESGRVYREIVQPPQECVSAAHAGTRLLDVDVPHGENLDLFDISSIDTLIDGEIDCLASLRGLEVTLV